MLLPFNLLTYKALLMRYELNNILKKIAGLFILLSGIFYFAEAQAPTANFTANITAGCSPLVVSFTDLSTGNPTAWSWNFGNGATSTLQNPTSTYFTPGTYTVTLTVSNAAGSNTLTRPQYITVYEPPTVDFSGFPTMGCFPVRTQFTDLSTPGAGNTDVAWLWDFGNGTQSTAQNPYVIFNSAGNFSITLKVTNDKGCSKVVTKINYIQVTSGVSAGFTNTLANTCRPPTNISFTNSSTGPGVLSYSWNFGDGGTSTLQNPNHTYLSGGTFNVTLITNSSSGCVDTVVHPVVITNNNTAINAPDSVCVNIPVSFQNASTPTPNSALWNFGDGTTSTAINPVKTYNTAGNYLVKLVNTYANCTDSAFKFIRIMAGPVPNFTAPVTFSCQPPLTVNFQDLSTGAISWQWDFGDGGTSTLQNPSHTYNSYGSFNVKLLVTNSSGCSDSITKIHFINIKRAQIFIPSLPVRGCVPYTINPVPVIIAGDVVTSYFWDFGDGGTSTLQNPTHTYVAQGTYTVKLIITTSTGCTDSLVIPAAVRVGTHPTANFSGAPTIVCAFQPVQFTDLSPAPVDEWHWDFGDGTTSTLQNPSHVYQDTGFFTVKLVVYNNGCPDSLRRINYIKVLPPIAKFNVTPNCANRLQFTFTDQSIGPITTWLWNFGDGTTSTVQSPVHTFPGLGTYIVTLTVTNGSCSHSASYTVHAIHENPDFSASPTVACHPTTISFTTQNMNNSNISSFFWNFGNGTQVTTTTGSANATYVNSGYYTVTLITTDLNGCKDTITKVNYIRINGPVANFSANNTSGCKGLTVTFNDLSTTDGLHAITNWKWDFGDGSIQNFSGPPFQHTYPNAGTYSVKLKITDATGCVDSMLIPNLIVTTDPHAMFVSADTLTCPGAVVHFTNQTVAINFTNLWNFGDGATSTVLSPTHNYAATGNYTVKLRITDQYGCSDSLIRNSYIHVSKPVASFTVNDSISSCTPLEVDFTNTSQYFTSLLWNFGQGGTSTLPNPIVYYNVPGIYIAKLYITSPGGCMDSAQKTIHVYDTAGSSIHYNPLSGCKPLQIHLNAFTPGPVMYIWDYGDGYVDSTLTPNVNHIYKTFGNFIPKVILKEPSGCLIPLTGPDTVKIIGANTKFGFDKHLLCDSGVVHFLDSTTFNDPITQFTWNFGDGGTSTVQNPTHNYILPGLYTVTLSTLTQHGCRDTLHLLDTIKIVLSPLIDIRGDTTVCINDPMLLDGIFKRIDTSRVWWNWSFPNGNSSNIQNPPQQIYTTAGNFIVTTVATNSSGCKDTVNKHIIVFPLPVVTMPGTITMQAGFPIPIPATYSSNVISYAWLPTTTLSCTTCPQPVASPKFNTNYVVSFVDSNGCKNRGAITVIVICKNANVFMPNTFSPNNDGVNDVFYPRGKGINRAKTMRIFNRWGEVVFEARDFPINDPNFGWNGTYKGNKPQPGVYVYQVEFYCDNGDVIHFEGNVALIL
jgi:gliding motility-associated-like protein